MKKTPRNTVNNMEEIKMVKYIVHGGNQDGKVYR